MQGNTSTTTPARPSGFSVIDNETYNQNRPLSFALANETFVDQYNKSYAGCLSLTVGS